jgi:hypothetical protein
LRAHANEDRDSNRGWSQDGQCDEGPSDDGTDPCPNRGQAQHPAPQEQVANETGGCVEQPVADAPGQRAREDDSRGRQADPHGNPAPVIGHVVARQADEHEQDGHPDGLSPFVAWCRQVRSDDIPGPDQAGGSGEEPRQPMRPRPGLVAHHLWVQVGIDHTSKQIDRIAWSQRSFGE